MSEGRHLIKDIGKFVRVTPDEGQPRFATLLSIGPSGCRVRYSDGVERVVAAWRIAPWRSTNDAR